MFDLRYHVASLAAVFLALAIGILLGVAISGKVRGAEQAFGQSRINELQAQLADQRDASEADARRLQALEKLVTRAYPALMDGRLKGRSVAVVFLGPPDGDLRGAISTTLDNAGAADAGTPTRFVAFDLPVDSESLDDFLLAREELTTYAGDDFSGLGQELGRELANGTGDATVLSQVSGELVQEQAGSTSSAVDGVVVVRSWTPAADATREEATATASLLDGVLEGLDGSGIPVVGVTTSSTERGRNLVDLYQKAGLSTVDDVDFTSGRLALALLLAGGQPGRYGVEDCPSCNGPIPPVEPVSQEPGGG